MVSLEAFKSHSLMLLMQRNLAEVSLQDLFQLAKQLKYPGITTLRLFVFPEDQLTGKHSPTYSMRQ